MKREDAGWLVLLVKNPILALVVVIVLIVFVAVFSFAGIFITSSQQSMSDGGLMPIACQQGELNQVVYEEQFNGAGVFEGKASLFIQTAMKYQIDPVILASIAFHETGKGTSKMVKERNNPGGLYNSATNSFFVYSSLDEGIDAMAKNLYKNYISMGLYTIEQIGSKYAPIGVENDPNNLNIHWVPNITNMVATFGGLTMNCESMGLDGGLVQPVANPRITSKFGNRVDPIDGSISTHKGIDFGCSIGDPIFAVLSGTVYEARWSDSYGNLVILQHGDKYTLYAHMSQLYVTSGQSVQAGSTIGACGSTGRSTGPHLHFEIQLSPYGVRIDPLPYLQGGDSLE